MTGGWTARQCCMCGEDASDDPALVVQIAGQTVGYLCDEDERHRGVDPQLHRLFVEWVRAQHPDQRVTVEIPSRGRSYTLEPLAP